MWVWEDQQVCKLQGQHILQVNMKRIKVGLRDASKENSWWSRWNPRCGWPKKISCHQTTAWNRMNCTGVVNLVCYRVLLGFLSIWFFLIGGLRHFSRRSYINWSNLFQMVSLHSQGGCSNQGATTTNMQNFAEDNPPETGEGEVYSLDFHLMTQVGLSKIIDLSEALHSNVCIIWNHRNFIKLFFPIDESEGSDFMNPNVSKLPKQQGQAAVIMSLIREALYLFPLAAAQILVIVPHCQLWGGSPIVRRWTYLWWRRMIKIHQNTTISNTMMCLMKWTCVAWLSWSLSTGLAWNFMTRVRYTEHKHING